MPKKSGKSAAKSKKTAVKSAKPQRQYKSLRLQKRIKHPVKLPGVRSLTKQASNTLWQNKRLFLGITLIYGALNIVLAQGIANGIDASELKQNLTGSLGLLGSSVGVFTSMLSSAGSGTNQAAGVYQVMLGLISSLAIIWALRQVLSGAQPRIRDAYYQGMYPLVPFILVLLVVSLQLIPLAVGSSLYTTVIDNGIAIYAAERLVWLLLFLVLALLTFYMISSSLFALYIVTLQDMTPMQALRSARELVRNRRWTVLGKLLCLPVMLVIAAAVVMVPVIMVAAPLAQWVFFALTMLALPVSHAYIYTLYRELLNE